MRRRSRDPVQARAAGRGYPRGGAGGAGDRWVAAALALVVLAATACASGSGANGQTQVITDASRRHVTVPLPSRIHRIVMVGAPPDIDGFVIAMGDGNLIVNGVPTVFSAAHYGWKILEPGLTGLPNVESDIEAPVNQEELVSLKPDIVFTQDATMAGEIQKLGIPTVVITEENSGTQQERDCATLVGKILGKQKQAAAYASYFDTMVSLVSSRISAIPASQRPTALYLATRPFRRNGPAMEWYLRYLGATDVAGTAPPLSQFTTEQILGWNPDFVIAHDPTDVPVVEQDPVLKNLKAVTANHVVAIPQDLNEWGDFDVAAPLALLWTAKDLYPQRFSDIDMASEATAFYSQFFGETPSTAELNEILFGIGGSQVNFGA